MFSMGRKNKVEEETKTEEIVIKKAERTEEKSMDNNIKKVDVKIGESATIIGTMKGSCIANIEGCFEGTVDLDGDLVLAKTGRLKADVRVKNAVISGNLNGTIYASESVQILPTATVNGDITSKTLVIERGARFIGNSKVIEDEFQPVVNSVYANYSTTTDVSEENEEVGEYSSDFDMFEKKAL